MAIPAHKTEYFIIENSNLQKKANTAFKAERIHEEFKKLKNNTEK